MTTSEESVRPFEESVRPFEESVRPFEELVRGRCGAVASGRSA
ncbi:hypothetical protein [Plantactinospora sp. BB1]|nr:hypothetical protein [Plantactinospora sp. BB1]